MRRIRLFQIGSKSGCFINVVQSGGNAHLAILLIYFTLFTNCRGETASGRSGEARARQIARVEEPQAQDARATKQARPETKKKKKKQQALESKYG